MHCDHDGLHQMHYEIDGFRRMHHDHARPCGQNGSPAPNENGQTGRPGGQSQSRYGKAHYEIGYGSTHRPLFAEDDCHQPVVVGERQRLPRLRVLRAEERP